MAETIRLSPAKINLTLRVSNARGDGFHEIESLIVRVGLSDTVRVSPRGDGVRLLSCDDPSIPTDDANLALRAARLLADAVGDDAPGADIHLEKRIPAGAGLGGGSSNAATTLMILNDLWGAGLSRDELATLGSRIGSDVPLFMHGPLCVVSGRGEMVRDIGVRLGGWVVLAMPGIFCGAGEIYAAWDGLAEHPERPPVDEVLSRAASVEELMPHLFNDLEAAALSVNSELREFAEALAGISGGLTRMTGSGSAFFRLFEERESAETFGQLVRDKLRVRVDVVPLAGVTEVGGDRGGTV